MVAPEYMFGSLMRPGFLSLCNCSIVITIQGYWINNSRNHTKFSDELFNPNCFLYSFRSCYVLGFCGRVCCILLFRAFPADCSTSHHEHITRLRLTIIFIRLEAGICIPAYLQVSFSINQEHVLSPSQVLKDVLNGHPMILSIIGLESARDTQSI